MADKNPYDDLLKDVGQDTGGGGGGGGNSLDDAQYDFTPEETQASSFALSDIFGQIPEQWALNAPDTITHITLPENQMYQAASMQALQYLQLIYGANLTPTLQAALIPNKEQREYAYSVLQQIAQQDIEIDPGAVGRGVYAQTRGADLDGANVDPELMSRVIADPKLLDTLDIGTRNAVIAQARAAGEMLQGTTGNTARQFYLITGQTASQNYDVFLSPDEKSALEKVLGYAESGKAGAGAVVGKGIGVAEVQNAGAPNPTIVLDEKWAQARPVRAAAVMDYLRTQLPDVSFRVGEKGLVGKVLDVLGKPVDVISAIPAAGLGYIGEVSEELSDKIRYNDQDRARMAQQAAELERKLKNGNIAPEEWDDALRVIQHLKSNAEDQISYDFGEAIDLNLHPREAGFGFAENYTRALDLLPGDAGYDIAYAASGLAANIVFDPLNFALPALSGAKAARHTVAGAAELPGKVDFALDAYRTMGNVPDATKVARASVADVLPAAPKPIKEVIGKGRYVILETIDDDIAKALKARGYNFGKVKLNGKDAVLVPKVSLEEGIHLAKEAGLQQFLSTEGLVDVGARTVRQVDEVLETSAKATDVVRFGDKTWGYRIGNKTTKLRPERIAGGYTKNWFYQKFVKTPEEWITTKPAREAVERLWTTKQAVGRDAFLARVQRLFNVDERVARVFANARTEDDMLMALQAAMTGNIKAPFNQAKTMGRLDSVLARLDEGDSLRAEGRVAESAPADFDLVPPRQLSEGDDLASIGQASDEFYYHMTRAENAPSIVRDRSLHPNASFYGMDPDFVPPEMRVPRAFVADSPEVAWNATKFVNDRMVIRVPKGEVDALGLRPDTAPVEGSFYATTDIPILNGEYLAEDGAWHKLIEPADARFAELELSRADDVAEAAFLRSINSGRDFNIALREVPDSRAWRRFLGREGRGSLGNALMSMAEFAERFPGNLIGQGPKRLARWLLTPEGRVAEKSAQQASAALGRWFRPHGAGSRIQFPWAARAEGELADTVIESADNIRNFLKTFAVPNAKAEKLVGRFLDLRNQRQSFEWTKDFWFTISDESPLLASTGREQIRDIWPDLFSERAPGYITKSKPGEFAKTEPTLFRVEVDENGNLFKSGVPVFTADMLHGLTLPNLDEVLELISFNRRMLRNWSKAGGARQPIAKGLMQGQRIWESINRFWKTSVLLAKMPLSLPLRIIGEEHLRIAAFDEASLVNHPVAWFRAARNTDEFALMAESSAAHLGLLGEQFLSRVRFARQGRHIVTIQDGDAYFRAASAKVAKLSKSPEVSRWYIDKTPQEVLATMESGEGLARGSGDILALWDELIDPKGVKDRIDAVRRAQLELEQLAAGNEKVKAAMKTGRMVNEAGDEVLAGTEEFSAELARMHATGEWKPTALELPASTAEFEFVNPQSFLADFRDKAFNYFYTKPDVALARAPLYRSIALREFKRLRSLGWSEGKALSSSQAYAARRVADTLYRIGETSGAHHWLRNIAPFFPAFQELTTTWLYRVPKAMGGGFWAPGAVRLLRKADVFFDFMKNLGVVQKDENGEWYVPIPGLGKLVSAIVGSPVPLEARASLSSFTGVLPDPFSGVQGLLPGLGAPSAAALTTAASHWDGVVDDFADYLLPFGREVSLGPALVDRLMMAAGVEPPWVFGSPDYQKTLKNYAIDDAIRMEMVKSPPPSRKEGESDQAFQKRYTTWSEDVLERAERRASLLYVVRGVSSVVLPFSASYDTKYDHEMQAIWTQLASFPDGGGDITGPMIDAFKAAHPEAVWYTNGKSINLSPDRNFSRTDSFAQEWTDQMRDTFTPAEFLRWSVGMQSYSVYANKLDRAYEALGDNAADVLLHGFQKFDTITPLRGEWQDYLDWTDSITPAGERSFHDLFKEWNKARGKDELNFTKEQELALEVKQVLGEASRLFIEGGVRDASYRDVSRVASQILSDADFPASSSKVGKGIDWWWKNVGDPYGEKVSALYDSLEETDDPFKRAGIYAQLREIANTAKGGTYGGVKMPTPEEVFFNNLSPEEQKARKLDWATLPVEWLTTFQMKQIGVKASPKLEDLATFINDNEVAFDKVVAENDISTSSNDYEALRRAFDLRAFDKAKDLGLVKEFALMRAPVYKRIDQFFSKEFSNTSWQRIVSLADDANRSIDAAPDGSITSTREAVSRWLVDQVRQVRSNDQRFNGIMERLEVAFAPGGKDRLSPDLLVLKLFFNYYGDSAPAYLYV